MHVCMNGRVESIVESVESNQIKPSQVKSGQAGISITTRLSDYVFEITI